MKANYNASIKKTVYTIEEAVSLMLAGIPKQLRAEWKEILTVSLTRLNVNGSYADSMIAWKKIDSDHLSLVYKAY